MKKTNLITIATGIAMISLLGCKTGPTRVASPLDNPSLAGSCVVVETTTYKGKIDSMDSTQRKLTLTHDNGVVTCKVGPDARFALLKPGDQVKAKVIETRAIFLVKNGAPPSPGSGVKIAESPEWSALGGATLPTVDRPAKIIKLDSSYRLLTLQFEDGKTRDFKTDKDFPLDGVVEGDQAVVREVQGVATEVELL